MQADVAAPKKVHLVLSREEFIRLLWVYHDWRASGFRGDKIDDAVVKRLNAATERDPTLDEMTDQRLDEHAAFRERELETDGAKYAQYLLTCLRRPKVF